MLDLLMVSILIVFTAICFLFISLYGVLLKGKDHQNSK